MPEVDATILIPDISGFTEFISGTELSHGSKAIHMLIETIIESVGDEFEVSEIEGDAVLLIRTGPPPSRQEIHDLCIRIFNAFHYRRTWMSQHTLCPCRACRDIEKLTLKFIAHHGPLSEMRVGRFVKHSGADMIIAHRLLKNGIDNNEYLLMTESLLNSNPDNGDPIPAWTSSSESYTSLGSIPFRYYLLNEARQQAPMPPAPDTQYLVDNTAYFEIDMDVSYWDAYMTIMNIPARSQWTPGLRLVEQEIPDAFIGNVHLCTFDDFKAIVSPVLMEYSEGEIKYAESCRVEEMGLRTIHEFVFTATGTDTCHFAARCMQTQDSKTSEDVYRVLSQRLEIMAHALKAYIEKAV